MKADFKTNLRAELDYLDLTVKELSVKTGIPKGTLDCYLGSRASIPPVDIAVRIASALGVSVEYLVNGQEMRKQDKTLSYNVRAISQILTELNDRDVETILAISKIFKSDPARKKFVEKVTF